MESRVFFFDVIYTLENVDSGLAMDIADGKTADNINVQQ